MSELENAIENEDLTESQKSTYLSIRDKTSGLIKRTCQQQESYKTTLSLIGKAIGVEFVRLDGQLFDPNYIETDPRERFVDRDYRQEPEAQIRGINADYHSARNEYERENAIKEARAFFLFHGINPLEENISLYEERNS